MCGTVDDQATTRQYSLPWGLPDPVRVRCKLTAAGGADTPAALGLYFSCAQRCFAEGRVGLGSPLLDASIQTPRGSLLIRLIFADRHRPGRRRTWALRLRALAEPGAGLLQITELCSAPGQDWLLRFSGQTIHTHRQLALARVALPAVLRLGAFTQHGQLFNLKDWFLVEQDGMCSGLLALHPGAWSNPRHNVLRTTGDAAALTVYLPLASDSVDSIMIRRSYLLAHVSAAEAVAPKKLGIEYFEPPAGYAAWPARMIARYGFARPERLAAYRRQAERASTGPPEKFALGDATTLEHAFHRVALQPALAGDNPFWKRDFNVARDQSLATLERGFSALTAGAYLHPLGNPVALRDLAPSVATLHMLDFLGQLADGQRRRASDLVAVLAELLWRRDFYPHHVAMAPEEAPHSVQNIYRGMLNQNFNTDRYTFVGLAGCLLPRHPRAALWRQHAVDQFRQQMRAFVYPGGAWEESHTYANHVKLCLLPLTLALRQAENPCDLLADERFRSTCRFFVPLLSPPDAILEGKRGIPAIGDHGYSTDYGFLFGWLAGLCPDESHTYLWAWREMGSPVVGPRSLQVTTFGPLLLPDEKADNPSGRSGALAADNMAHSPPANHRDERGNGSLGVRPNPSLTPRATNSAREHCRDGKPPHLHFPALFHLPGYGAAVRHALGQPEESLLVVRCGEAWGHYHPDQGSFWWWAGGVLLCADADLARGPLKHEHLGHCVLGYPGREPMQYLDRPAYHIDECSRLEDRTTVIRCQLPIVAWRASSPSAEGANLFGGSGQPLDHHLAPPEQPHSVRTFHWIPPADLEITDEPLRSPDGAVTWTVHVLAENARQATLRTIEFPLPSGRGGLILTLPRAPRAVELQRHGATWRATLTYPEMALQHHLHFVPA